MTLTPYVPGSSLAECADSFHSPGNPSGCPATQKYTIGGTNPGSLAPEPAPDHLARPHGHGGQCRQGERQAGKASPHPSPVLPCPRATHVPRPTSNASQLLQGASEEGNLASSWPTFQSPGIRIASIILPLGALEKPEGVLSSLPFSGQGPLLAVW